MPRVQVRRGSGAAALAVMGAQRKTDQQLMFQNVFAAEWI
jgi:hypothetical protein